MLKHQRMFTATTTALLLITTVLQAPMLSAQTNCAFTLGFKLLHDAIPDIVGNCLETERFVSANGNAEQRTTGGLLVWRKADNWTAFTDGGTTWINGPEGLASRPNAGTLFPWESPVPPVAAPAAAPPQPAPAATLSPQDLYNALLTIPFDDSELPPGFTSPQIAAGQLTSGQQQYHAIGQVMVTFQGPDWGNLSSYTVYPSEADARGRFEHAGPSQQFTLRNTFTPSGFSNPVQCFAGTLSIADANYGDTTCLVLVGNVEVTGFSILRSDTQRGNDDNSMTMAKTGVAHLNKVKDQAAR